MPENTKRSDYQCETPKNWITGKPFSKLVGGNVRLKRPKFCKIGTLPPLKVATTEKKSEVK